MISLKDNSVSLGSLTTQALLGIVITKAVLADIGADLVITSIADGEHSWNSKHYSGNAWDVRTWFVLDKESAATKLRAALGHHYDVVVEEDHIHIEYDPKYSGS